jgi:hypothetical protein
MHELHIGATPVRAQATRERAASWPPLHVDKGLARAPASTMWAMPSQAN